MLEVDFKVVSKKKSYYIYRERRKK